MNRFGVTPIHPAASTPLGYVHGVERFVNANTAEVTETGDLVLIANGHRVAGWGHGQWADFRKIENR